ncbi:MULTISPECIES: bifunctional 2-polyprenyl-6-hydroxyphenol methylase/3-demethylubiquinol 3-O-methyltransferase UbiG [unclassified Curtobacterium]|uniref:class I SAM-dependent methyltransferase n=1 Tax=unclassified Curtobacterium TaxID=257496 RepID=UPI0008DC6C15|nr:MULTISPECIES: methyltransferase domain-containing protein [unclassified Curtobacterium]OIH96647.1 SAM-dependent methyltransferase [Curtobacterium sp. MCBA15_003]OII15218.1 SAM-dependent methyltransferase [Curtobacterium sp. MCBA15_009]OII33286.1 SAM-dependent methyltransferase [Curtobacterium sp. MMLR14_006]
MTMHAPVTFGAGGGEPYARALRTDGRLRLTDPDRPGEVTTLDVGRWSAAADQVDRSLLENVDGAVIDIGCGPGRMLVAAAQLGLPSLGVDVSAEAVAIATRSGGTALQGSVFDPVPDEGHWDTALVIDGNIGIGGDPAALLDRCRAIVREGGRVVVETNPDPLADRVYTARVMDADGHESAGFPWAEVGLDALHRHAAAAGLVARQSWTVEGRSFCELVA